MILTKLFNKNKFKQKNEMQVLLYAATLLNSSGKFYLLNIKKNFL